MGARLLPVFALALALAFFSACVTRADTLEPRHPGDRCFEVCPEGMVCAGTVDAGAAKNAGPGRCELGPDRCTTDIDCHENRGHCVGASTVDVGYCAYGLPL